MKISQAMPQLVEDEAAKLINDEEIKQQALHNAEQNGINALRAIGVLDDDNAVAVAIDSLNSGDTLQRANAVETLDSIADRDIVRPILRLWEPTDEGSASYGGGLPERALRQALQDTNSCLRACDSSQPAARRKKNHL